MKNFLLTGLGLAVLALGLLTWQQRQQIAQLQAELDSEKAAAGRKVGAAEQRSRELEQQLTAATTELQTAKSEATRVAATKTPPTEALRRPLDRARLTESPEFQQMFTNQQKMLLDSRYAALFKNLRLTPAELEKFKTLLVDRQSAIMDLLAAGRNSGVTPRSDPEGFRKLLSESQAEVDQSIQELLGAEKFGQYQNYERTLPHRTVANQLEQSLSFTDTPLTPAQSERLIEVLAANAPRTAPQQDATATFAFGVGPAMPAVAALPGPAGGAPTITPEAIAQAQSFLSPPQLQALQKLQQHQAEQQKFMQSLTTRRPASP